LENRRSGGGGEGGAKTPLAQNQLSNRIFESYDAIVDACCQAWNSLTDKKSRIQSIASRPWAAVNL
jgi:hypothetical protein